MNVWIHHLITITRKNLSLMRQKLSICQPMTLTVTLVSIPMGNLHNMVHLVATDARELIGTTTH